MRDKIIEKLKSIEDKENIEILYACESGSRVWGFSNYKSDYDIRFIYKFKNIKNYLTLKSPKDVIECSDGEFDIVGWDIKKALLLHYKDNPNLREWIYSSEIYIDNGVNHIFSALGGFNIKKKKNHYSAIALNHWKKCYTLNSKKYLYVLRSILCWKLLNRDIYPPININELLCHDLLNLDGNIKDSIEKLISYHQNGGNLSEDTIVKLNEFIENSLKFMKIDKVKSFKQLDDYDERFRELLLIK